jgi:hypothetical protein
MRLIHELKSSSTFAFGPTTFLSRFLIYCFSSPTHKHEIEVAKG